MECVEGVRLMAPFGFTRPVPRTRPGCGFVRVAAFFERRAGFDSAEAGFGARARAIRMGEMNKAEKRLTRTVVGGGGRWRRGEGLCGFNRYGETFGEYLALADRTVTLKGIHCVAGGSQV